MRAVQIKEHGSVADLVVSDVAMPSLGPDDVLVKIEASGINPSDVSSVRGRFPNSVLPRIVGRDFAGVIVEGPADLIGAKVWGSGGDLGISRDGAHAQYMAIPRSAVSLRPQNLSAEEAAGVGVPFVTTYSALFRLGNLKESEWVIIAGAAGSVGQAATKLANATGANVIGLVRDSADNWVSKADGVRGVAQSDQDDLEKLARELTKGKGADLGLNGVGASVFKSIQGGLGIGGRQVIYSVAGGEEFTLDLLYFYKNNLALLGLDTAKLDTTKAARILDELRPLFESGKVAPPTLGEKYPLPAAAEAYGRAASGKAGKVILTMTD
ncbi:MAG TPA: zinc-binding alcohol dehydrogenase family protein [Blastocatellia bacterium]